MATSIKTVACQHGLPLLTVRRIEHLLKNSTTTIPDLALYCYNLAIAGENVWNLCAYERLVSRETLLAAAEASEARRCDHKRRSRLDGFPVSLKANFAVAEYPLTAGSRILNTSYAVGYDSTVAQRLLRHSGALWMGATTLDEFGMGSYGTNVTCMNTPKSATKATRNPLPLLKRNSKGGSDKAWSDNNLLAELIKLPVEAICEIHEHLLAEKRQAGEEFDYYVTGGSSSGSAAAVAHGSSLISLGSDTGGSVRLPAAWCGLVGYKPTYGLLPRHGIVAYASSLDTVGVLASSAHCAAVALDCLLPDFQPKSESLPDLQAMVTDLTQTRPPASFLGNLRKVSNADLLLAKELPDEQDMSSLPLSGIRVGIPAAFCVADCSEQVTQAWDEAAQYLEAQGATVEIIGVEHVSAEVVQASLAAYYILACAEASSNLARYDGFRYGNGASERALTQIFNENVDNGDNAVALSSVLELQYANARTVGFGREVQRRLLLGTSVLSSDRFHTYYEAAAKVRAVLTHQLHKVLQRYDLLLVPTCVSTVPPRLSGRSHNHMENTQREVQLDATEMLANDIMTVPISLTGLPAISLPFGKLSGCRDSSDAAPPEVFRPGLQLVAGVHGDVTLMQVAAVLQEAA